MPLDPNPSDPWHDSYSAWLPVLAVAGIVLVVIGVLVVL